MGERDRWLEKTQKGERERENGVREKEEEDSGRAEVAEEHLVKQI